MIIVGLCILIVLLVTLVIVGAFFVRRLVDTIARLEDIVERSLDLLDTSYGNLSKASEIPIMYDEPVIRGVVADIADARNAVLMVANELAKFGIQPDDEEEGE